MARARDTGRLPILTGGTGLYFASLTDGIAAIPDPGPAARDEARALLKQIGPAALHARLAEADPDTAAASARPTASASPAPGRSGAAPAPASPPWQSSRRAARARGASPPSCSTRRGPQLRAAIAARAAAMLRAGGLEEVRALLALDLDPALPAMRAHGVPELAAHLRGELTLAEAVRRIELVTGQYTKRQATWFRHHQLAEPPRVRMIHARITGDEQFSERNYPDIFAFIESLG